MEREVYVEVLAEDDRASGGDYVGRLRRFMYGTQDAPAIWQKVIGQMLVSRGFIASKVLACVFFNPETGLRLVAHVYDFLVAGDKQACEDLLADLQCEFEVEGSVIGMLNGKVSEVKCLGRRIRMTPCGLEISAYGKLARSIIEEADLVGANGCATPGLVGAGDKGGVGGQCGNTIARGC